MKTKQIVLNLLASMVFMLTTVACNAQNDVTKERTSAVVASYINVKNALVESNVKATAKSAVEIATLLDNQRVEGDLAKGIKESAERISESSKLDEQRAEFETLTKHVYNLVKAEDGNTDELYYQYCPMAFNNKGAYWLSSEKEIRNPYFGDKMLKCGVVKETIK